MKLYEKELVVGTQLLYDGEPIKWVNPRSGKVIETMRKGKYAVTRLTGDSVYVKPLRKNAVTEHRINKIDIVGRVWQLEFVDLTTAISFAFNLNKDWYINDEALIAEAKKHNKNK